ncbi:MAG: glycosyltransferase family 2 protein [Firmicutes bacterium]|nr:glycosyltransferase family 2 protein [Bacillota bacterium]
MKGETVSVVVPAYNIAPWLPRALDSLLTQTYPWLEILVVDDGSTDETQQVIKDYATRDGRVRGIFQENRGVTAARLAGVAAATGDWIGFADGDDAVEPDMYRHLLENAHGCGADISHCGHRVLFPDGRVEFVHNTGVRRQQDRLTGVRDLLDGGQVESSLCTKLYRRALFAGLSQWIDPTIKNNEDYLMNYYLFSQAEKSVYEDFCPYHYILRTDSASYRQLNEHSLFDPIRAREKILACCPEELQQDARRALLRNLLFAYAQLSVHPEKQYDGWRQRVRDRLKEQTPYFSLLSARNRVLAWMICDVPALFSLAYRGYVALFQREEQH